MQHGVILLASMGHDATQGRQHILGKAYSVAYPLLPVQPVLLLQAPQLNNKVNGNKQTLHTAAFMFVIICCSK